MLRDITLGQYYQTDSRLHRLDPRVKIVATLIYIVSENTIAITPDGEPEILTIIK